MATATPTAAKYVRTSTGALAPIGTGGVEAATTAGGKGVTRPTSPTNIGISTPVVSTAKPAKPVNTGASTPVVINSGKAQTDLQAKQGFLDTTKADIGTQSANKAFQSTLPKAGSVVDLLNSQGKPSDFNSRAVLAKKYGIDNYAGTSAQNTQLYGILSTQAETPTSTAQAIKDALGGEKVPAPGDNTPSPSYDLTAENQAYDSNTAAFNQAMDSAFSKYENDIENIRNGTFPLTATEHALIDSTKAEFDSLREQQTLANKNYTAGITAAGIASGRSRYAPEIAQGEIANAVNVGIQKLAEIDTKSTKAVADLEKGFMDQDYKVINDSYKVLTDNLSSRRDALQKLHDDIVKQTTDARDFNYKAQQDEKNYQLEVQKEKDQKQYQDNQIAIQQAELKLKQGEFDATYGTLIDGDGNVTGKAEDVPGVINPGGGMLYFDPTQFGSDQIGKAQERRAENLARKMGIPILSDAKDRDAVQAVLGVIKQVDIIEDEFRKVAPDSVVPNPLGVAASAMTGAPIIGGENSELMREFTDPTSKLFQTEFGKNLGTFQADQTNLFSTINTLAGSHPRINTRELELAKGAFPTVSTVGHKDTLSAGLNKLASLRAHLYGTLNGILPNYTPPKLGVQVNSIEEASNVAKESGQGDKLQALMTAHPDWTVDETVQYLNGSNQISQ